MNSDLVPAHGAHPVAVSDETLGYMGLKPGAPLANLTILLAARYGLDPLLNHLEIVKQRLYVTRDGYLDIAHRSGQLDGIVLEDASKGNTGWRATVSVWRRDMRYPFTYSAGCGLDENNDDPEAMAIARAERRALKRAFPVLIAMDNMIDGVQDGGTGPESVDLREVSAAHRAEPRGPRWTPSAADQRDAHKALAQLDAEDQRQFLARYEIPQFTAPWPAAAVAEVLGFGPGADE